MADKTVCNIIVNALREGVRLLEDHADMRAKVDDVDGVTVDIDAISIDGTLDTAIIDEVVHAIETS